MHIPRRISFHSKTDPEPSTPSEMQIFPVMKMVKKVKRGVKRQIRRATSFSHVISHPPPPPVVLAEPTLASLPPFLNIVKDFAAPSYTFPVSLEGSASIHTLGALSADKKLASDAVHCAVERPRYYSDSSAGSSSIMSSEEVLHAPIAEGLSEERPIDLGAAETEEEKEAEDVASHPPASVSSTSLRALEQLPGETVDGRSDSPPSEALTSPPAPYIEPEVPDPFLIDDDESEDSEDDDHAPTQASESQQTISPAAHEISLAAPQSPLPTSTAPVSPQPPSLLLSPNINKDVPPPPSDSDPDEEDAPEIYVPGLVIPTMFLPIPNTDPLTTLLAKYINPPDKRPVRDLSGEWQNSDFHTLVMTNSWRALAKMARDRIVTTDPEDLTLILGLWYLRLSCLARLRLFNQTSAECTNLFSVLNAIEPPASRDWLFERLLPFELEIMQARLKYWAGDPMSYLDALSALLRKCRNKARMAKSNSTDVEMWKERGARICLIIASQMVEMKDYGAAAKLLEPLCTQDPAASSSALRSAVARIYLHGGYIQMAKKHFAEVAADASAEESTKDMNAALLASAEGAWDQASKILAKLLVKDADNFVAVNNLGVALLSQGKVKEGIEVLEKALKSSPSSVVVAEPFLFNLSTLYELRSATATEKKRDLLIEVAKWSGDGLKTTCLKMPTN